MSRRKREKPPPLRLPAETNSTVFQLVNATGWSRNESLAFIVNAGWNALNGGGDKIPALRQVMTAAIAHYETQKTTQKRLAITARKLRDARSALVDKTGGAT
ncbi:MAG: hypothetical protein P4N60_06695 [Verrucomicrobiae bacterium]|nr:hypothetical protein [Verrucomicrobiae bacterium]